MTRVIESVEAALAYLVELEDAQTADPVELAGELSSLRIWIDGPKYHASVPGELARGLWEFQEAVYKAAAFALNGNDDIRRLSPAQKADLELVFELRPGSSDFLALLKDFFGEISKGITSMSELNRTRIILCLALILAGGLVSWKALDVSGEAKKEQVKKELSVGLEAERTKQLEVFAKVANAEPIVKKFEKAAEDGTKAVVRSAADATEIKVGRTHFDRDDIQEVTQRAPRTASTATVVDGMFRVFSAEARTVGVARYVLSTAGTGEFPVAINESEFSQEEIDKIWKAIRERSEIRLEVNITKNKGVIKAAQVIAVL